MNSVATHRLIAGGTVALLVAAALGFWLWQRTSEARAIHDLEPAHRKQVLEQELRAFSRLCSPPLADEGLESRCQDKARFIQQFPECGSQCERTIMRSLPRPER